MALKVDRSEDIYKTLPSVRLPEVYYPDSDDQLIADNDPQYRCMTETRFALERRYEDD